MKRERHPWGSSRVYYSIQGVRREFGENFLVTVMRHSRSHDQKTLVISPGRYAVFVDMLDAHTSRRFQRNKRAYDTTLRPLEQFIAEHEFQLVECA